MADDVGLGEVMRNLAAISVRLDQLASRLDRMADEMDRKYVPREVYTARHDHLSKAVRDIQEGNEEREKFAADTRRQLLFLALGGFTTAVFSLVVTVVIYLVSGGH